MQINRLFEIVYLLLEKETATAKELAQQFGVSVRTIYRDIDILSTADIPVYTNKGKGGGISLLENFVLDKSILSEEEQNQIIFALQSLEKLDKNSEKKALEKMSRLFHKQAKNWIEIDFSNWSNENNKFEMMKQAILKKQVMEFTYFNSYGEETKRQVEPLQIWFKDKAWYIKAYCRVKQDYRVFKIARMREIKVLEETFERELPLEQEKKPYEIKFISLELEISKEKAYRVYDEFEKENIEKKEDGNFIVHIDYPENNWVYEYILSFGEHIKVIAPEYAKNIIKDKIQKMIKSYS